VSHFTRSAQAEEDLIATWLAIASDNLLAADRILDRIDAVCHMLALHPFAGAARDDIAPGLRYFPVTPHLVLYRILADDHVEIVRVVDGRRDLAELF
jgi:toxin ParE1/3/4